MAAPKEQCLASYEYIFNSTVLKGKVAFVTGGGSGIGFRIAEILMRHGCQMVIASRNADRVKAAAVTLEGATGQRCLAIQMDVRKPQEILNAVDQTIDTFKRLDILVNNAAGNFLSPASGLSFNAYKTVLEIDTMGTFNTSKVVYEKFFRDHGGVIINISATLAHRGTALQAHAGSAKAAIDALTRHFAVEWGPDNVRVIGIAPGPIMDTEGVRRLGGQNQEAMKERLLQTPLQRAGTRAEIAHVVLFLVSPAGSLITGETIVADGGEWMGSPNSMHHLRNSMKITPGARIQSKM